MRNVTKALLVGGVLLLSLGLRAQDRPYDRDHDDRDHDRDHRRGVVERTLRDLDDASASDRRANEGVRSHFQHAREDLDRFRDNWSRGDFDKDRLDRAIGNIDEAVHADHIDRRDREILSHDLVDLRDLREHHDRRDDRR